ncbi:putative receptor-like protein kinase, partial [Dichanthelium oligosanthes]
LILLGYGIYSLSLKIALESVCYAAIACLYTFSPSSQKERALSGIFLSLLAVVIVLSAASAKRSNGTFVVMTVCNLLALTVYCIWKLRSRGGAAADDTEAPLEQLPALKEEAGSSALVQQTAFHIEELPRKFSYNEIRAVTGDFGTMVGRGGSAEVFRGLLDNGTPVAVKRITSDKPVGEADFMREISIVASVHHRSLVRLLGYSLPRGGDRYLVYPFFENGSLDWWLFNDEERRRLLPWPTRRRIAVDVARALAYLHHECHRQILHLDVKPANILLDGGLRAHVSDFGVSMSIAQGLTSVDTRGRGTLGYMAPEISLSKLSVKSDVYSYGMTLLELISGRRSFEKGKDSSETPDFFARVVQEKMARGALMEVVDAAMARADEGEVEEVVKCTHMSGLHDSSAAAPRRRRCCCSCASGSVLCKIIKGLLHAGILATIFSVVVSGFGDYDFGAKIALESLSYAVIVCLFICTSSDREQRIVSGVFLGILAVVIVAAAPSAKGKTAPVAVIAACNLVALSVYCIWKFCVLLQACLRLLRAPGAKAAADAEVPLAPVQKDEEAAAPAGCRTSTSALQTTFLIEDLPRKFSYDEIRAMTGDFGTVVGRGGSGEVFRGLLDDGTAVAVKRITSYKPVGEEDFLREISIVANVHQRSLVRLLGYCLLRGGAGHGQYLIYPFFENGSLDWWLFNGEERRRLLPWPTRRRIAIDVARALAYLHHECRRQILHLDIKPANILLDGGLRAHVSDFGISMSIAQDMTSVDTRGRGTLGYMAPEIWVSSLSAKSDVYSYGMTLLELVSGRRGFEAGRDSPETPDFFARVVWEKMARGELTEVVDAAMANVDKGEVEAMVKVALCCVQHRRDVRPSMLTVVDMLEGRVAVDLPLESRLSVVDFMEPLSSPPAPAHGRSHAKAVGRCSQTRGQHFKSSAIPVVAECIFLSFSFRECRAMSGPDDSTGAPPHGCCCCACASVLCKILKVLLHVVIVFTVFVLMIPSIVDSFGAKIALQSVSYAVLAFLYIYTSSDREERIVCGVFIGVLAVVIVAAAPSVKGETAPVTVMFVCNLVALLVYCIWKISAMVKACLRRLRARGKAAAADPEAPLAPLRKSEAAVICTVPVRQTTFQIEDLPRKFSYDEIRAVTGDFGAVVGRGGSAEVFRGVLDDGTAVAVKRMISYRPVGEEDFLREISIVANVHQRSLVRLLGYCLLQGGPGDTNGHGQYLVYPFFENGSLDWWLFNGEERRRQLPWPTRRRMAVDVARALAYLHHECRRQILHLDIKPANILLDGGFRAHVSDFGISMSIAQDLTSVDTCGRGTPGYMAPEIWFSSLSTKSDVYSYGMTLLELVGGRRGYQAGRDSSEAPDFLARIVREKMARGELMDVVDAAMSQVDKGEAEAVVKVALCCVQHQRELRPSMVTVVDMLEGRVAADLPPDSRPSPIVNFAEPLSSPVAQNECSWFHGCTNRDEKLLLIAG